MVKSGMNKMENGKSVRGTTDRVKIKSAQGTMAQRSTQTKTAVETVKQDESSH